MPRGRPRKEVAAVQEEVLGYVPEVAKPKVGKNDASIEVTVTFAGIEYTFNYVVRSLGGNMIASQLNKDGLGRMVIDGLRTRFGNIDLQG